ncbi:MAG: hypothetical protein JWP91_3340 [Fibrobacteres bacterium]|nr:hypothetical protein [Fibrobacterota bacterium]
MGPKRKAAGVGPGRMEKRKGIRKAGYRAPEPFEGAVVS